MFQGQHVTADWPLGSCKVVILEIRGDQALVQELGTQRAEWISLENLHR